MRCENVVRVLGTSVRIDLGVQQLVVITEPPGTPLATLVREKYPSGMPPHEAVPVLYEAARGLLSLHNAARIRHVNVRPTTLMVRPAASGVGYGAAWSNYGLPSLQLLASQRSPSAMGILRWHSAPEQLSPEGAPGPRAPIGLPADVWGFGLVCLYALTGSGAYYPPGVNLENVSGREG